MLGFLKPQRSLLETHLLQQDLSILPNFLPDVDQTFKHRSLWRPFLFKPQHWGYWWKENVHTSSRILETKGGSNMIGPSGLLDLPDLLISYKWSYQVFSFSYLTQPTTFLWPKCMGISYPSHIYRGNSQQYRQPAIQFSSATFQIPQAKCQSPKTSTVIQC